MIGGSPVMKRIKVIPLSAVCAILAGTLVIFTRHTSAQTPTPAASPTFSGVEVPPPVYNPVSSRHSAGRSGHGDSKGPG